MYFSLIASPNIDNHNAEKLLKASDISFKFDNDYFMVSDYEIEGNTVKFILRCNENQTGNDLNDKITITVTSSEYSLEIQKDLIQEKSDIKYIYKIVSDITDLYVIPAEGGTFNIPLKVSRLMYLNDKLINEIPYNLKNIRYVSNCVNIAWGHLAYYKIEGKIPYKLSDVLQMLENNYFDAWNRKRL